jgi:DNA-binding NarL/FixJ family response regulator
MKTRVLIVDDNARFRALARQVLTAHGYAIAAEAADGAQALAAAHRAHPDAALVDVGLPDTDGFTLARQLTAIGHRMRILLTSTDGTLGTRTALASSTAVAFIPKDELAITDLKPWLGG